MVNDRFIDATDLPLLTLSLARDEQHKGTEPEFFTAPGAVCKVYGDEQGPILFARASKALRLDLQYVDNKDVKRNMKAMLGGFDALAQKARENGFLEIIFNTNSEMMRRFCIKRLGFTDSPGELRRLL